MNWSIQNIWNDTLMDRQKEVEPRDYIRASEIGGSFLDRYYKMIGEPFSNDFDARTLRVFEAGRIFEWMVMIGLMRCGLMRSTQNEVKLTGKHLDVIGHLDFIAGGKPNLKQAVAIGPLLDTLKFPPGMANIAQRIFDDIVALHPDGLPELVYDIKSVNSMVFWKHNKNNSLIPAYKHHALQVYTYMKGLGLKEGRILYISKDDLTLAEVQILPDEELEMAWQMDVGLMSSYYRNKEVPPPADYIVWNGSKYELNWKVTRSNYFSKITGVSAKDQDAWIATYAKLVNRCNYRVKETLKKFPSLDADRIQLAIEPYLQGQLDQIASGQIRIEKEITIEEDV